LKSLESVLYLSILENTKNMAKKIKDNKQLPLLIGLGLMLVALLGGYFSLARIRIIEIRQPVAATPAMVYVVVSLALKD
jgi:hypothetical protein